MLSIPIYKLDTIFKDLKVVELASVLAGPAVGMFFAELGATVVKIENKNSGGDFTRQWRQKGETDQGPSSYYSCVNWGKKSVFLDLKNAEDHEKAEQYIKEADVVISNFKKGDDIKLGLDFETLKKINPTVILGHISGFGSDSDRVAFDLILQAESGFMSMNGQSDGPPTKIPLALIDILAAHQLKEGILCALLAQQKESKPYHIEVSLYDSAVASLINQATNWLMNGNNPQRMGSLHPNIAPYGEVFTTRDGQQITFAIGTQKQFEKLCDVLQANTLKNHRDYGSNAARVRNREALFRALQKIVAVWEVEPLIKQLHAQFVPVGKINTLKEVFVQKKAQDLCLEEEIEGRKTIRPKTAVFQWKS